MIKFAVIADVQYGDLDDSIGRSYRQSLSKYLLAAGEIAAENVDFALQLGDASQEHWNNHLAIKELFKVGEKAGIKWRHVLGNHDFLVSDKRKPRLYKDFGLKKPGYYDFEVKDPENPSNNWRFIVLNGNEISSYAAETPEEKDLAEKERARWKLADGSLPATWNGSVSPKQLHWLENKLKKASEQKENVIVCSHFPLFANSKSMDGKRTKAASLLNLDVYYSDMGISTWNGREVLKILDRYPCVKGYFAGHLHEGSYGVRNNVAHVTFKGIVETNPNAFAFVELTPNSIIVDGREAQSSHRFDFA